jgi:hypothetical protein
MKRSDFAKIAVVHAVIRIQEVRSVGDVERIAMQFKDFAFKDFEVLLHAKVVSAIAGAVNLVASKGTHSRVYPVTRSIGCLHSGQIRAGEGRGVKPGAADALRVPDFLHEIRPIAGAGAAGRSQIDGLTSLKKKNVVQLPSANHRIQGAGSVGKKHLAASKGQIADERRTENLPLILVCIAIVRGMVVPKQLEANCRATVGAN